MHRLEMVVPMYSYLISNLGKVYRYDKKSGKHIEVKQSINSGGYYTVTLPRWGKEFKWMSVHRLVAMAFIPNPDNLPMVNHIDGNKLNNCVENLEWCTAYHNNKHARDTGLNNVSESNHKRWQDKDWAEKTKKHFSEVSLANGLNLGYNNPRWKYRIYIDGKKYTRREAAEYYNVKPGKIDRVIRSKIFGPAKYQNDPMFSNFVVEQVKP